MRALVLLAAAAALAAGTAGAHSRRVGAHAARGPITAAERASIGASVAFVREAGGRREAFGMDVTGATERPLVEAPSSVDQTTSTYPAAVSADGSAVALLRVTEHEGVHVETLLVRERGANGAARTVAPASRAVRNPAFSPDGKKLAFESDAASFRDLFVVARASRAAESFPERITSDPNGNYEPSWFADGSAIAFTTSRDGDAEIYRARADGSGAQRLTTSPADDLAPRVSPDGRRIAFLSGRAGVDRVFLMDANGGGQRPVRPLDDGRSTAETEREHTWSPDGRKLAFVGRAEGKRSRIFVWDADLDTTTALTDGSAVDDMPVFSPDGRHLAFVSDREGNPDVWLVRSDGTGAVRLGSAKGHRWLPSWVPGGVDATTAVR